MTSDELTTVTKILQDNGQKTINKIKGYMDPSQLEDAQKLMEMYIAGSVSDIKSQFGIF